MQTKIQKWGNSLGLRIPRSFAKEAGVAAGSDVDLSVRNGDLVIRKVRRKKYPLDELLRDVTARNVHGEIDAGAPEGDEAW